MWCFLQWGEVYFYKIPIQYGWKEPKNQRIGIGSGAGEIRTEETTWAPGSGGNPNPII